MVRVATSGPGEGRPARRHGFALPTVILVLALLALLSTAAIETSRAARRGAALAQGDVELQSSAERALGEALATWPASLADMAVGEQRSLDAGAAGSGIAVRVVVTRTAPAQFWVVAEARTAPAASRLAAGDGARRRINAVLALPPLGVGADGALVAAGAIVASGGVSLSTDPVRDGCPPLPADSAFVAVPPGDSVLAPDGAGVPWRRVALAADPAILEKWGGADWSTLAAGAGLELADGAVLTADGGCTGPPGSGWGSAEAGCARRWGVVHAHGSLTIAGGSGAGVLLVDGRLRVTGAFRFDGLVVARGGVELAGDGTVLTGAVVAGRGDDGAAAVLADGVTLRASRCAVWEALASRVPPRRVPGRWWGELL